MTEKELILSPCIRVCTIDEKTGYCLGCARTLEEVCSWALMPDAEKKRILSELEGRKAVFL
jgi:hypothetical protein